MSSSLKSLLKHLFTPCAGALLVGAGITFYLPATLRAQSVEKAETTQDSKKQEDELSLARAAVAKPGDPKEKPESGRIMNGYSVQSSMEVGYRWVGVGGNADSYRSQVDVREGLRLLGFSFDSRRLEDTPGLYDTMRVNVNNMGGDSSQTYSFMVDKARWYKFDANIRRFNYFRQAGPNFALGWRDFDLRQQVSDYNLKLFPQRAVRLNFGYSQSMATGRFSMPFSFQRDLFPVLGKTRWGSNDYKAGIDARVAKWNFNGELLYRKFKNDPYVYNTPGVQPGFAATDNATLTFLDREYPTRSRSIVTHGSAQGTIAERLHVVIRGLHDDERMDLRSYYENAAGTGSTANQQVLSALFTVTPAVSTRKSNSLDAGVTYDVNKIIGVSDTFRYSSYNIVGDNFTSSITTTKTGAGNPVTGAASTTQALNYVTDYKSYWNTLDLNLNFGRKFLADLGWRVMKRDIAVTGAYLTPSSATSVPSLTNDTESSTTNAFVGGMRWRPINRISLIFDVEKGDSNAAFVRLNPLTYTRFRFRTQFQVNDKLNVTGTIATLDKTNPTPQVNNDSNSRSYGGSLNWDPNQRVWLNFGYDYYSLYSTADLRYQLGSTIYFSRLLAYSRTGSAFVNARVAVTKNLDMLLVYNYIRDRGAPSGVVLPVSSVPLVTGDNIMALPYTRHNPEGRIAYRFNNNVTANLSYRHYRYSETNLPKRLNPDNTTFTLLDPGFMDYHAGVVTMSVKVTF